MFEATQEKKQKTWRQQQQQQQIISVLFNDQRQCSMFNVQRSMIRKLEDISSSSNKLSLYCSMINVTWSSVFNVIPLSIWISWHMFSIRSTRKIKHSYKTTKLQKKSIHDICCISYKTTKLQKKVFMIYVIHVRLNVALMEGESVPLCDF